MRSPSERYERVVSIPVGRVPTMDRDGHRRRPDRSRHPRIRCRPCSLLKRDKGWRADEPVVEFVFPFAEEASQTIRRIYGS